MEELFAIEELASQSSPVKSQDYPALMEIHSNEDPVLVQDSRVLNNLIHRQESFEMDYFSKIQTEIRPHMRKIVADWMLEVTEEQQCQPEVFHLAINYLDRVLSSKNIKKSQFQLLASVCLFLASKFKETCPLPAEHLVIYTDYSVSVKDIMQWEMIVLNILQWDLSTVTPYSILDNILRSLPMEPLFDPSSVRKHAETFLALAATEHLFSQKSPVTVAISCLGSAMRGLNSQGLEVMMSEVFLSCGQVQVDEIHQCMNEIEVSINLSMLSFQSTNNNVPLKTKIQQPKTDCYPPASTTPTDLMDVSKACVY